MYTCSDLVMSMIILSIQVFYLLGFVITSQQGNAYSLEPCVCGKNPTSTEYLGISSLLGTLLKTLGSLFNSMGSLSRPKVELGLVLLSVKRILFSFLFLKTELPRNWDYQLGSIFCRMFIERNSTKSGDISNIPCHLAFSYLF